MKQYLTTYVLIFIKTLLVLIATILAPIKGLLLVRGFRVFATDIISGGVLYHKIGASWVSQAITLVV